MAMRNAHKILVGKPEGRTRLRRPRRRWKDDIKKDLWETGFALDSSDLGSGPLVGSCEHSNEPPGSTKYGEFLDLMSDY
jgi:hypothetical protein